MSILQQAVRRIEVPGNAISGVSVGPTKFVGVASLNQLENAGLSRPTAAQTAGKGASSKELKSRDLREDLNRTFDKARRLRADRYSFYIEGVECGNQDGGTPPITLYAPDTRTALSSDESALIVPYNSGITAIDGETQTEARFILRDRLPETGDTLVSVVVYYGISEAQARQILHDANAYANPIPEKKLASFNDAGPLSKAVNISRIKANVEPSRINLKGSKPTKTQVLSLTQGLTMAAGFKANGLAKSRTVTASDLMDFNRPGGGDLDSKFIDAMTLVFKAAESGDINIRNAPTQVMQVAGALVSAGRGFGSLNWRAANDAYNATKAGGRGGARLSVGERLAAISSAF